MRRTEELARPTARERGLQVVLAVAAMLVNVISGLTGKFLLDRSRRRLAEAQQRMRLRGLSAEELEDRNYWDSLTFDAVRKWRVIHFPITLGFAVLAMTPTSSPCSSSGAGNEALLWLLIVIAANLVVLVALAFVYPHLMVSPGPLSREHAELATDCFACHAPWRGAAAPRCTECHALADIGLRSTKGVALPQQGLKTSFHQELIEQDCVACHSDHAGPKLTQRTRKPFSHELLRVAARDRCESCHAADE